MIRFEAASTATPALLKTTFRDIMAGKITPSEDAKLCRYQIDTRRGLARQEVVRDGGACEFPVVSPHVVGLRHTSVLMLSDAQSPHGSLNQVTLLNTDTGAEQSYRYPDHIIPEEHLLVGLRSADQDEPWVLGSALDVKRQRNMLFLFERNALQQGPVATAAAPYALPVGLHGKFVAA